jgi:protein-disulfide isomerase
MKCKKNKMYCIAIFATVAVLTTGTIFVMRHIYTDSRPVPNYRIWGYKTAPLKVEVFSDLQCPACSVAHKRLHELKEKYHDKFSVTFKHFPLPGHKWAFKAAVFAECAGEQSSFNEFIDEAYARQQVWYDMEDAEIYFFHIAENLPIDIKKFHKCVKKEEPAKKVQADLEEATKRKIKGTPYFSLNGCKPVTYGPFEKAFLEKVKKYE